LARIWVDLDPDEYGREYFFLNKSGDLAFNGSFEHVTDFCHGVAQVSRPPEQGVFEEIFIDADGKRVFSWKWRR